MCSKEIEEMIKKIKFGEIKIIIHDGQVTMIEKKEKMKPKKK